MGAASNRGKWYYRHYLRKRQAKACKPGWARVEATVIEALVRDAVRQMQIPEEAKPIIRNLAKAKVEMAAEGEGKQAVGNVRKLENQLARAKRLYVVGDYTEEEFEAEKRSLEKLIGEENRKISPPPYDVDTLIEKIERAGAIIAETGDLNLFKRAISMLFERLEATRQADGAWKLSKAIPREEFREFF